MVSDYKDVLHDLLSVNDRNGKHVYGVLDMGHVSNENYIVYKYLTESYKFETKGKEFVKESYDFLDELRCRLSEQLGVAVEFTRVYRNLVSDVLNNDSVNVDVLLGAYMLSMKLMLVLYNFLVDIQADDLTLIDEVMYVGRIRI